MKLKIWIGLLGLGILLGLITVYKVYSAGFVLYAKTDVLVWTLPLATYIFFSLTSAGLAFVSSIPTVFGVKRFEIMKKRTMFLEFAVLIGSFVCLIMHLGSPLNLFYYLFSPNPASPLWWLGMLYGVYLVVLVIAFKALIEGKSIYTFNILIFLIAIATSTTLGWLLGMTDARPSLDVSFLSMYFPFTAFVSGLSALLLVSIAGNYFKGQKVTKEVNDLYGEISKTLGIVAGLVLILFFWRTVAGGNSSTGQGFLAFKYMVGSISYNLELWGLVIPAVLMLTPGIRVTNWGKVTAASLILVGMLAGRLEFILSSEVMPLGQMAEVHPGFVGYMPTSSEFLVTIFGLSVVLMVYTLGDCYLKLDEVSE